ncbi:hypothetical protein [Sphingomonas sp. Leaf242]|uniref:hypothetical protein n=1 Tax=Sphingomonas sp. Leaf242 TaxID=1736304 RepID=UPI000714CF3A|nr:hypothetical protein [Sphingomonas sp. Leaf242]KQO06890.1 hypothetical protein ASF09_11560 [Sphingomonas sp. Leaf242]
MNEHEASVANRLTDAGHPYVAGLTVWAMQKREAPKGLRLRTITFGGVIASWPFVQSALKAHGWM